MADAKQVKGLGKSPPRSMESFGVAGLLGEKSKVFYSSIFTTKHIGRVTDLIAAKLLDEGLDEMRLRAVLLFGAFEVFRSQGGAPENASKQRLAEPLVVECGLDDDKVAIGVSFTADEENYPRLDGLAERVAQGKAESVFEELLVQLHQHSHWTVVRGQDGIRRVEIVAVLGVPSRIAPEALAAKPALDVVQIPKEQKADPPKVKAYIELADLDYPTLLKEDISLKDSEAPATGEVLMHGLKEVDDAVKVRAADLLASLARKVGGSAESGDGSVQVKGQGGEGDSGFKVTNGGAIQVDGATFIKGSAAQAQAGGYALKSLGVPLPSEAGGQGSPQSQPGQGAEEEGSDENEESSNRLKEVIDKVKSAWPFRFGKGKTESEDAAEESASGAASAPPAVAAKAESEAKKKIEAPAASTDDDDDTAAPLPAAAPIKISTDDIEKEAQKLTKEIETGIEQTVNRAQSEAGDLKKEMGTNRAKRWVDGLMTELVAEKARLADASKALNASIRQKEIEFRTKEQILTEELKRRDDMIRQKTNALNRAKDQLSQAAISAERLKSAKAGAADDAHYKQKYGFVQKMLNSAKDENSELVQKIEDLKNQLMSAQLNSSKRAGPSATDFTALQSKYERSIRQADEFKKTNQQLLDKLAEAKKERVSAPQDDVKKRLEAAMKMATGHQRDAEKLQIRVEEMQREHMKLQAELNKATIEAKAARLAATKAQAAAIAAAEAGAKASASAAKPGASKAGAPAGGTAKPAAAPATAKAPAAPGASGAAASAKTPTAAAATNSAAPAAKAQGTVAAKPTAPATASTAVKPAAPAKPATLVPANPPVASKPVPAAGTGPQAAPAKPAAAPAAKVASAAKPGSGGKSNPPKAA